jgi:hypothetical protein
MVSKCGFESKQEPNDYFSFSYVYRIVILVQYMHISAQYVQNPHQPTKKMQRNANSTLLWNY